MPRLPGIDGEGQDGTVRAIIPAVVYAHSLDVAGRARLFRVGHQQREGLEAGSDGAALGDVERRSFGDSILDLSLPVDCQFVVGRGTK